MSRHARNVDYPTTAQAWLIQLLDYFIPAVAGGTAMTLCWVGLAQTIPAGLGALAMVLLLYTGGLFWARTQAHRGFLNYASGVTSTGLLVVAVLVGQTIEDSMLLSVLLTLLSTLIALPYFSTDQFRLLVGVAWCVVMVLVLPRSVISALAVRLPLAAMALCATTLAVMGLILLLLAQWSSQVGLWLKQPRGVRPRIAASGEADQAGWLPKAPGRSMHTGVISDIISDYVYYVQIAADGTFSLGWITEAFTRMTGYTYDELARNFNDPQGLWISLIHPEDVPCFYNHLDATFAARSDVQEFRIITRSEEIRWVRDYMCMMWDDLQQREIGILGAAQDITECEEAEQEQRAAEERFARVFHLSPSPMTISTLLEGRFLDVSESFLYLSGYRREEVIGRTSVELELWSDPEDRQKLLHQLQSQGRVCEMPCTFRIKSGELRYGRLSVEMLEIGGERYLLSVTTDVTQHLAMEAELHYSQSLLDSFYQLVDIGIAVIDEQGYFVRVNSVYCDLYGAPREQILGKHMSITVPPEERDLTRSTQTLYATGSTIHRGERRMQRVDGSVLDIYVTSSRITQPDGRSFCLCTAANISEQKRMLEALRGSEERFRTLFDNSPDAIFVQSLDGIILDANRAACELHGLMREELIGKSALASNLVPPDQHDYIAENVRRVADGVEDFFEGISYGRDGHIIPIEVRAVRVTHLGEPALLLYVRDISEREETAEQLYSLTNHDALTRLPNRKLLRERLKQTMDRARRLNTPFSSAVLFLDVDHFKSINNSLGHGVGDQLLIAVAQRLREFVRTNDTVARVGGDEFAILIEQVQDVADVTDVANRLQEALTKPFFIKEHEISTTISIGIALSSPGYEQPEDMLRDAGTAMHYAKEVGGMRSIFFENTMYERAQHRLQVRTELPQAIEKGELQLRYQPIVELKTGDIAGFEALVRWNHPRRGSLSPATFVPIAEETGVMIVLGRWILQEVCHQARLWTKQLNLTRNRTIYVNLSGREFRDPDLVKRVQAILGNEGLGAFKLKLEITEGAMMDDADTTIETLRQLRSLGVELCIDDFGTGYSSLRYLQRFPVQTVKVDHSFITHLDTDIESTSIVRAIMLMAHTLGMDVVAEWVETPDQLVLLEAMGCEYGQGYLFSQPVDAEKAGQLLIE